MAKKPLVLLMAEDDPDDRLLASEAFEQSRVLNQLYCVENGEELIEYLERRGKWAPPAEAPRPGLILLDLNMPKMDGREALSWLKHSPDFKRIPVVVLTTSRQEADLVASYDLGAASYISKPVTFERLVELARSLGTYWVEFVELPREAD